MSSKKMRITTTAGAVLIADYDRVEIEPPFEGFAGSFTAEWDMRDGLIRDPHHYSTVRADAVKMIDYL